MAQKISKTAELTGTNLNDNSVTLTIPVVSQKGTWSNNVNSFAKPQETPPERRALNLNRWEFPRQITAAVTDEFVDKNHSSLSNKEEWLDELYKLAIAQNILEFSATNDNTQRSGGEAMPHAETSGFIHNIDFTEKAGQDNSVYDVTIKMVDEVPMNS